MWTSVRRIIFLASLVVAVSAAAASAQYNAPAAPSAPAAPTAPPATPSTGAPGAGVTSPYAINAAIVGNKVILTDAHGMTLYYLKNERALGTRCTGRCATIWPPALAAGMLPADPALGPVLVVNNVNGSQLSYEGHLLYHYSKDTAPGQMNGDGIVDEWGSWATATAGMYYQP